MPHPGSSRFALTKPNLGMVGGDLKAIWEMSVKLESGPKR